MGEPSAKRGGRAKRFTPVTQQGVRAIDTTRILLNSLAQRADVWQRSTKRASMKTDVVMRMAMWLVERRSAGSAGEAFAGDLLETFANGRSRWWCFAQALRRVASFAELRLGACCCRCGIESLRALHLLWQRLYAPSATRLLTDYRSSTAWPGSAVVERMASSSSCSCGGRRCSAWIWSEYCCRPPLAAAWSS